MCQVNADKEKVETLFAREIEQKIKSNAHDLMSAGLESKDKSLLLILISPCRNHAKSINSSHDIFNYAN